MNPATTPDDFRDRLGAPIWDDHDLLDRWAMVLPRFFGSRTLLIMLIEAGGRPVPQLTRIDDLPEEPDESSGASLAELGRSLLEHIVPDGTVALALARPGGRTVGDADRRWAHAILRAAAEIGVPLRTLHLATASWVGPLVPDDLLARRG